MKKLNNKGFTLMEVLTVIIVITVIMMITLPLVNSISKKNNEELYSSYEKMMEEYVKAGNYENRNQDKVALSEISGLGEIEKDCTGFVEIEYGIPTTYKSYIECGDKYVTTGFYEKLGTTVSSCPGCVYAYPKNAIRFGDEVESGYETNYRKLLAKTKKKTFIGMVLENNKVVNAYACGMYNDITPYCVNVATDNAKFENEKSFLKGIYGEYNNSTNKGCKEYSLSQFICHGSVDVGIRRRFTAETEDGSNLCTVDTSSFSCT